MSEQRSDRENRGRGIIIFLLILIVLIGIAIAAILLLGKGGPSILGKVPIDLPTAVVQQPVSSQLLPAPTILGADVVAVYDVPVSWKDNSQNEDGFNVYRERTDVAGKQVKAGSAGQNSTTFLDTDTYCGETYHYTVASYNSSGESPDTACWEITLPACPKEDTLDLRPGVRNGYNFLTGGVSGAKGDFYLSPPGGNRQFKADQQGQGGLIDLGATGDTPLNHVTLPEKPEYTRGGIAATPGDTYAALATDGQSVIIFRLEKMGDDAVLTYIVWRPEKAISGQCKGQGVKKTNQAPVCQCSNGDYICLDPNTKAEVSHEKGSKRCATGVTCGCQGTTLVCSDGNKYDKDPQCALYCNCEGDNMVCRDANKNQVSSQPDPTCIGPAPAVPYCGDGNVDPGEGCDPPNGQTCDSKCQPISGQAPYCGDGNVDPGEGCDPPDGQTCDSKCQPIYSQAPYCGDGNVDPGEGCDPPDGQTCDSKCQPIYSSGPVCGNGVVEKGEQCEYDSDCTTGFTCVSCGCAPP